MNVPDQQPNVQASVPMPSLATLPETLVVPGTQFLFASLNMSVNLVR